MDRVDQRSRDFVPLDQLQLNETDEHLIKSFVEKFKSSPIHYKKIDRGLSGSIKIVIKPEQLFPFLAKIHERDQLEREYNGDQLCRLRLPPLNMPPFEHYAYEDGRAILIYRYITGGRVSEIIGRLDTFLNRCDPTMCLEIVEEVLDSILKKCHWLDGKFTRNRINLPDLKEPHKDDWICKRSLEFYRQLADKVAGIVAPFGITHGDLHPKNILVAKRGWPVLIDFSFAQENSCVYIDYAKLEIYSRFQSNWAHCEDFASVRERLYNKEDLILPRSRILPAQFIHKIREILWRNCLSNQVGLTAGEIDMGYRAYLVYFLTKVCLKTDLDEDIRKQAVEDIEALV